jgi:hypothetical protein
VTEQNQSGNRWEKPADTVDENGSPPTPSLDKTLVPDDAANVGTVPETPAAARVSRFPAWVTRTRLIATGAAAAIFLGGGAIGYTVADSGNNDHARPFPGPAGFDRDDDGRTFGGPVPGGQPPGGQAPQRGSDSDSGSAS